MEPSLLQGAGRYPIKGVQSQCFCGFSALTPGATFPLVTFAGVMS